MGTRDKRVDQYIARAPEYARPILRQVRSLVHDVCPDVEETMKWRTPTFMYHGILGGMAAFKTRAMFGLWKGRLLTNPDGTPADIAMGRMNGLATVDDLPPKKVLTGYIRQAMKLNEAGVKVPRRKAAARPSLRLPGELKAALARNAAARQSYDVLSPSHRREYIEWIAEAKGADTRGRRVKQAIEWLAQGKSRNWKYEKR